MRPIDDYDYELPPGRVAVEPARPRDASRLLVYSRAQGRILAEAPFRTLADHLRPGDCLVVNDSRVLPSRVFGRKNGTGANVEIFFLDPRSGEALVRPARRIPPGTRITLEGGAEVEVERRDGEVFTIAHGMGEGILAYLEAHGRVPLPPYIARERAAGDADRADYQTVYAHPPGSVAAPTAGLHFTNDLLDDIKKKGVGVARITLHVGPGTFRPVSAPRLEEHVMHAERYSIDAENAARINAAKAAGGRIVAVGTTAVRTLEHVARSRGAVEAGSGETDLFITEGFPFRVVDALVTNFHLPRSTLLVLVCAFAGHEPVMGLYRHAVAAGYRFYSYGDATLLL